MSKSNSVGTLLIINGKTVGALKTINGIEVNADVIDVTDLGNEDGYKEKIPGFKDAGDIAFSGFLDGDDEGQDECYDLLESGNVVPCSIVFPEKIGKTWSFNAGVSKFSTSVNVDDAIGFEGALAVSGKPTLAATESSGGSGSGGSQGGST